MMKVEITEKMSSEEIKRILKENEQLKEENKMLRQIVSMVQKDILMLDAYMDSKAAKEKSEMRQYYLAADKGIVGKLMLKIEDLPLKVRTKNILKKNNCNTFGDVVSLEKTDLLRFRLLGKNGLTDIMNLADSYGLHFGMDVKGIIEESLKEADV